MAGGKVGYEPWASEKIQPSVCGGGTSEGVCMGKKEKLEVVEAGEMSTAAT
jgi:hypothetical protein